MTATPFGRDVGLSTGGGIPRLVYISRRNARGCGRSAIGLGIRLRQVVHMTRPSARTESLGKTGPAGIVLALVPRITSIRLTVMDRLIRLAIAMDQPAQQFAEALRVLSRHPGIELRSTASAHDADRGVGDTAMGWCCVILVATGAHE